ncbi:glycosyltransferase [Candidatus Omnitrophota bacterium]
MNENIFLSIVIPCKNEEKNIARCLKSIVKGVKNIKKNTEIILVDSFSSDKTIEITKDFPVNIIQLKSNWLHSPSAARYLGCLNVKGKYIFIIDADMELHTGFLEKAIDFMEKDNKIAGLAGMGDEFYKEGGRLNDLYKRKNKLQEVDFLGGAALYRKTSLDKIGYFNPYLQGEEEFELAQRLKETGFKLFSLPYRMTTHYASRSMEDFLTRAKNGLFFGIGQMLRLSIKKGKFWSTLLRFKLLDIFIGFIIVLTGSLIYVFLSKNMAFLILEAIVSLLFYLSLCFIKRSLKQGTLSIVKWILINVNIIIGFIKSPKNPNTYPRDVRVIRKGIKIDYE